MRFVGSNDSFSLTLLCFFSHRIKLCGLPLQQSVSRCIHRRLCSTATCGKMSTAITRSKPLLPCYCYAIKTYIRIINCPVSQPASAGSGAVLVNCKLITDSLHDIRTVNLAPAQVSYRQIKLSLQELNQLSCWHQVFKKFVFLNPNFHWGNSPFWPPLRTPMEISKETIGKIVTGNQFHVTLPIVTPGILFI